MLQFFSIVSYLCKCHRLSIFYYPVILCSDDTTSSSTADTISTSQWFIKSLFSSKELLNFGKTQYLAFSLHLTCENGTLDPGRPPTGPFTQNSIAYLTLIISRISFQIHNIPVCKFIISKEFHISKERNFTTIINSLTIVVLKTRKPGGTFTFV